MSIKFHWNHQSTYVSLNSSNSWKESPIILYHIPDGSAKEVTPLSKKDTKQVPEMYLFWVFEIIPSFFTFFSFFGRLNFWSHFQLKRYIKISFWFPLIFRLVPKNLMVLSLLLQPRAAILPYWTIKLKFRAIKYENWNPRKQTRYWLLLSMKAFSDIFLPIYIDWEL